MKKYVFAIALLAATPAAAETITTDAVGCVTQEDTMALLKFAQQKDNVAFMAKAVSPDCNIMSAGETVHVMERAVFAGLTLVRKPGSTRSYWMISGQVRK